MKKKPVKKEAKSQCPSCGYCPECGRAPVKAAPVPYLPYYPWWGIYQAPYWHIPYSPPTWAISTCQQAAGVAGNAFQTNSLIGGTISNNLDSAQNGMNQNTLNGVFTVNSLS